MKNNASESNSACPALRYVSFGGNVNSVVGGINISGFCSSYADNLTSHSPSIACEHLATVRFVLGSHIGAHFCDGA